ncbi:MAG: FGGY family carbohydrate kinase [Sedimentitalea sp.]|uniref:FGGY-family carbohydrate kinase n=1 Tax=Sedimentitalea sp. TaxID=2048915 RepID=UPI0032644861
MEKLWLGLDVGTTAVKAAAYTPDGRQVALAEAPSKITQVSGGGTEQDMDQVWQTVVTVLSDLVAQCGGAEIEALGIAAQGDGLWCVTAKGAPAGPAMLWNDTRTADDLDALKATDATAVIGRGCNTSLWSGTSGMLWRWVRKNRPEMAANTGHILTCVDWIGLNLTGEMATDFSDATIPFLDIANRRYAPAQIEALECGDLAGKLLAPRAADSVLGQITDAAATATSLPAGLTVSVGTLDLSAMIVGMGLHRAGETMMIMGTTAVVNILTDQIQPADAPVGASCLHPTAPVTIRVLAPTTGAAAFDWFAALHPQSLGGASTGEIAGRMNALVETVPPGANGVTFLPYLNGERAPFVAPNLRGAFHGLSSTTSTGDMGRAVMEGAALSLRHCFEEETGLPTSSVQLTGGGSKNPVWCQIIADVVGQPVLVSQASDHGLWGAAALGASAAGLGEAVTLARRDERLQSYTPQNHAAYGPVYARYAVISRYHRALQAELNTLRETKT